MTPRKRGYTVTGIPYKDYIKSAEWAEVKARYRASRLPKKCVVCQSSQVDLHHKTYNRLGKERLTDLVPLCRAHHSWVHKRAKQGTSSLWSGPKKVRLVVERAKKKNAAKQCREKKKTKTTSPQ